MDAAPPPQKPPVIYIAPAPTPKHPNPNGTKTVDEFIRDMQRKSRAAQPQPTFRMPADPAPIFRDSMPRFGGDGPSFVPVQAPQAGPPSSDFAATLGALFGVGLFMALVLSAASLMFAGFFMYLGAMLARRLLHALFGPSSNETNPRGALPTTRDVVPVKRILPDDYLKVAIAAAAADSKTTDP